MNRLLLRLYPRAWRERYGDELLTLLDEAGNGKLDVARAALAERLRSAGAAGPHLVVLAAWGLFTLAGASYAKWTEHWDAVTPRSAQHVPQLGYDVVLGGAMAGSLVVVLGALLTARHVVAFLRSGGWQSVRQPVLVALGFTATSAVSLGIVALWHPGVVAFVFLLSFVAALAAWVAAAVSVARRLELGPALLRVETILAGCATLAMAAMTAGATVWWASVARSAPVFMGTAPPQMVVIALAMLGATGLAAAGTARAIALSR